MPGSVAGFGPAERRPDEDEELAELEEPPGNAGPVEGAGISEETGVR